MTAFVSAGQASGGTARTAPAIPGLEQGNPAVTNRPAQAPGATAGNTPGTPQAAPPAQPQTSQEIRDQIREQIRTSIQNGGTPVINVPSDFNARNAVPQGAVDISIAFFVMIAVIFVGTPLARAFARRMDAQNRGALSAANDIAPQIEQLQQSVDAMSIELERITEAQRFQSKLLAGREKEPEAVKLQR